MGVLSVIMWGAPSAQLLIWKMGFPRALSLLQHLYINDLAMAMTGNQKYKSTKCSIGLFADDTAFWRTGKSKEYIKTAIQIDLLNLEKWSDAWGSNFPNLNQ